MSDRTVSVQGGGGGIGFVGLLTIVFIVLKLTGVIAWSWVWVLSPLWISFALVIGGLVLFGLVALIVVLIKDHTGKRAAKKFKERRKYGRV